ncbi:uncharacterized protein LOC135214312 isoform X2 [Macrobrachium nipponense]
MKWDDHPQAPSPTSSSTSSSSSSSSPSRSSSSTTTMLARSWGSKRHPLPPSDSQDLEDDSTLTEGGGGGGGGGGGTGSSAAEDGGADDDDDVTLPRSPIPTRHDRRMTRTEACDIPTLDDFEPRIPRIELRRPSPVASKKKGKRESTGCEPSPKRERDALGGSKKDHAAAASPTFRMCVSGLKEELEEEDEDDCLERLLETEGPRSRRVVGRKYDTLPYDFHPRVFREDSSFTLQKDDCLQASNDNFEAFQARRSSFGCEYEKNPLYSWDDQLSSIGPDGPLHLDDIESASVSGSLGNLLALVERHLVAHDLANNNMGPNNGNNNNNNNNANSAYGRRMSHHLSLSHAIRSVPFWGGSNKNFASGGPNTRLARSHTNLAPPPKNAPLSRASRSQGDLLSAVRPVQMSRRKWTTLRGIAALSKAFSTSSLSLRPKRRPPLSAATVDLGVLDGHRMCPHLAAPPSTSTRRSGSWSRRLRLPDVRLGQVYATLRGRRARSDSCNTSSASSSPFHSKVFRFDNSPQRLRCASCNPMMSMTSYQLSWNGTVVL